MAYGMDICLSNDHALEEATFSSNHHHSNHSRKNRSSNAEARPSSGRSLGMTMGGEDDGLHATSGTNMDIEEMKSDPHVPRVGMEFDSEAAMHDFYCSYAKRTGFNVRRGKTEYSGSDKPIVRAQYFLCSCRGHEQITKKKRYNTRDMRTGCDAKIKCLVNDGKWKISKVVVKHNHALTALPTSSIADEDGVVREWARVSNANHARKNGLRPAPEEIQDLIDRVIGLARLDYCSYYSFRVAEAGGMEDFFWRDSRSKLDYEHFGDVLVLDTRTWIPKYGMICAIFWGLNHHGQRAIFGQCLLLAQTVGSFHWLLDTFLESMNWRKPRTIITEVSEEIAEAVSLVLPGTRHCLPAWSILNSFGKNLSLLTEDNVANLFEECVFHVHSREEFESKWSSLIGKCKLHHNSWLDSLYKMREKWCHAFTKNVFSVGLLSKPNEDAGHLVGNLSSETITLAEIVCRCELLAKKMRGEEFREDMLCEKNMVNLDSSSPMEKEAERLYTRTMFKMFQEELINSLCLAIEEIKCAETLRMFRLTEQGSRKSETVKFDPSDSTLACSCGKFESVGILCVHALKVLNFMNIFEIPSRYLLKRWTKSAKDYLPVDTPSAGIARDSFMGGFMRKALYVAHMSVNEKRKRMAMGFIDSAVEQIANLKS